MNRLTTLSGLVSICLIAGVIVFNQSQEKVDNDIPGGPDIAGALEFDRMKKADPATGEIPPQAVMSAFREMKDRGYYRNRPGSTRSSDGWQLINDFFPSLAVTKMVYDPNDTQVFYFCTGEGWYNADAVRGAGVFKSTDAGATWEQLASTDNPDFYYCQDIDVHPLTGYVYVATRSAGLQRSTDGGLTWQKVLGSGAGSVRNSICDVEITSDGGVFVGIGVFETDGVYYSDNGDSANYAKQTVGLPAGGYYRYELATAPSDPDIAYAIPCSTDFRIQGIYRTDDRGETWQATELPGGNRELAARQAWYDLVIEVDPNDPDVVIAGGLNLWRTENGGGTWQQISAGRLDSGLVRYVHVDQHAIVFRNSDEVYFGNDGGVYKTTNFTDEEPIIYPRNDGYNTTQYYAADIGPGAGNPKLTGGTQDNGSHLAQYPGLGSFKPVSGADGAFTAFNTSNDDIFYTTTQYTRIFRFDNGGFEIPDTITNKNVSNDNVLFINPLTIDPVDPDKLYQASNIGLWRLDSASIADSTGWEKACVFGGTITAVSVSTVPEDIVFMGRFTGNTEVFMLVNASTVDNSSTPLGLDPNGDIPDGGFGGSIYCSSIAVDVNDANHLLVSYSNYGVISLWETENALSGSPTWTSVEGDLPDIPVNWATIHPNNPNVAYIATEIGVLYTNNLNGDDTQWIPCSSLPVVRTDMLKIRTDDNTIIAATHGRGIWEATLDPGGISNDIAWQERGPNNVGGRTRAIMIDPNDPSGKTIWAGSVSGGLWKTEDIDAISQVSAGTDSRKGFSVSPNPAGSLVIANLSVFAGKEVRVELISLAGGQRLHGWQRVVAGSGMVDLALPDGIPSGMYLLYAESEGVSATAKLMVLQ